MEKQQEAIIIALEEVGKVMHQFGSDAPYKDFIKLIDLDFYESFNEVIIREHVYNGWYTPQSVRQSLINLAKWLNKDKLTAWTSSIEFARTPKRVGIIMAGNIPLVGFHDFLAVLLSGHHAVIKLSSSDQHLFPAFLKLFRLFYPDIDKRVSLNERMTDIDALIATGSDNSSRYFEQYFGHLPHIIRKNRTSIAVLTGEETEDELKALGKDVFSYFGLGCRNVSKIFYPESFDLNRFFGAIVGYADIVNHHKYANNYDYYKAIYLMNQTPLLENGFLLTKESDDLFAPIAVLFRKPYKELSEVEQFIETNKEKLQVVIGKNYTPFGKAQSPELTDYADGINTLEFLNKL